MIFKSDGKGTDLNGFLDRGSHVQGELAFETTFRIDGHFTGSVKSGGDLIIGEAGEVEGEIEAGQVFVSGTVRGSIVTSKRTEITPTGKVFADLTTPSLVVGNGAIFEGRCIMTRGDGAKGAGTHLSPPPQGESDAASRAAGKDSGRSRKGEPTAPS